MTDNNKSILYIGCGGYDIFTALPLYFNLQKEYMMSKLATISYTKKELLEIFPKSPDGSYIIKYDGSLDDVNYDYFPEYELSRELGVEIYAIIESGLKNLENTYRQLIIKLNITAAVVCSTGGASILSGTETKIGYQLEEMMTIWTINKIITENDTKLADVYFSVLGVNTDTFCAKDIEIIELEDIDKNISILDKNKALIRVDELSLSDPNVVQYMKIFKKCKPKNSFANCCVMAALENRFGNYQHPLLENKFSDTLFDIRLFTKNYYIFNIKLFVKHIKYLDNFKNYDSLKDLDYYIGKWNSIYLKKKYS
jgi:hypothetical protein